MKTNIKDYDFCIKTQKCLEEANIVTVQDLLQESRGSLMRIPNFTRKNYVEIMDALDRVPLELTPEKLNLSCVEQSDTQQDEHNVVQDYYDALRIMEQKFANLQAYYTQYGNQNITHEQDYSVLNLNVSALNISPICSTRLKRHISTVGELIQKSKSDLLLLGFGYKSLESIVCALQLHNLKLCSSKNIAYEQLEYLGLHDLCSTLNRNGITHVGSLLANSIDFYRTRLNTRDFKFLIRTVSEHSLKFDTKYENYKQPDTKHIPLKSLPICRVIKDERILKCCAKASLQYVGELCISNILSLGYDTRKRIEQLLNELHGYEKWKNNRWFEHDVDYFFYRPKDVVKLKGGGTVCEIVSRGIDLLGEPDAYYNVLCNGVVSKIPITLVKCLNVWDQ